MTIRSASTWAAGLGVAAMLLLIGFFAVQTPHGAQAAPAGGADLVGAGENWPSRNADPYETAYSRLDQISTANVGRLGLAWSMDLPETSLQATPVAVGGVLYFTGSEAAVYAVDGATGKLLWKYDPETWRFNPAKLGSGLNTNRGVAYGDGRIYVGARDGRLIALDPKTGGVIWSVETVGRDTPEGISGAPRFFNGKVIIGATGADLGFRGSVTAYDAATGKQVWRFYTAPGSPDQNRGDPVMERAAATWTGEFWKTGTGGGVWDSITFDPDLNRIYLGAANAAPYDPKVRSPGGGDNLYTASVVAVDANTGKYVWHYQMNPGDSWDFDCTNQMSLADLVIDGKLHKVLIQAPKNGFLYVLDRESGKLISAGKLGKVTWADHIDIATGRPVEAPNIRYETGDVIIWPSPLGAHSWQSQAFSPQTGLVYVPYMQMGVHFHRGAPEHGLIAVGGIAIKAYEPDLADGKGALVAWDPVTQKQVWRVQHDVVWNGGVAATAGGLVFEGAGDGYISAYDAKTGQRLWHYYVGMGINAAPMTYSVGGKQYVSILAGYGGTTAIWGEPLGAGWSFKGPRRLLTFALDAGGKLGPSPPRYAPPVPLDDPSLTLDPAQVAAGEAQFLRCAGCHGIRLYGTGGPGPDLRESPIALSKDSFWSVVHDGALMPKGMPAFPTLTRSEADQIYAYIRAGARQLIAEQQAQVAKH